MRKYISYYIRNFDYPLFFVYVFLCLFGLVMIYSSSMMVAIVNGKEPDYYYKKQLFNLVVAFFTFVLGAFFPYKYYSRKKIMMFMVGLIITLMFWLLLFGTGEAETGSRSWINLFGIMSFQPSELAKLIIILYFAGAFYNKSLKTPMVDLHPNHIIYPIIVWIAIIFLWQMKLTLELCLLFLASL